MAILKLGDDATLLFPSDVSAEACKAFLMRGCENDHPASLKVTIHTLEASVVSAAHAAHEKIVLRLNAVSFPEELLKQAMIFWRLTGLGVSSRMAEDCLNAFEILRTLSGGAPAIHSKEPSAAHGSICKRIAAILNSSTKTGKVVRAISNTDVYLYQSGMAAIYYLHQALLCWRCTTSVVFGFPYELTLKMLDAYGPGSKFFGFATSDELDELEKYLETERQIGRNVQAVWCECPSNPLLRTPDFSRLRRMTIRYRTIVIVDETIGGFANVDLLCAADVLVTSLTKSFSGYSNVMGGSVVLNPSSAFYPALKKIIQSSYRNDYYVADALQLEINSRDFLSRTTKVNTTTMALVMFFRHLVSDPSCAITAVYHPSTCWSLENYHNCMRPRTEDFEPGYGGLFTLEFASVTAAKIFFDASELHKGPSLGANVTLLQPYVQTVFHKEKAWAARHGLKESIVRVSVGLEDQGVLLKAFKQATRVMVDRLGQTDPSKKLHQVDFTTNGSSERYAFKNGGGIENTVEENDMEI